MDDLVDRLAHVLWIGGGPCVGKTTLARLLAGKYDLKIYSADWHHSNEHSLKPGGVPAGWDDLSMDERWVRPSPAALAERDVVSWSTRFEFVIEDLLAMSSARPVVAEGPTLFPWTVAQVVRSTRQAIFLVPTADRREAVLARRHRDAPHPALAMTTDPDRARHNIEERDEIMARWIATACAEFGMRCERVDRTWDLDDALAALEGQFGPHLPATLNV